MKFTVVPTGVAPLDYSAHAAPPVEGWFGEYGGAFVPETLYPALERLRHGAETALEDPAFRDQLELILGQWVGRPTPLTRADRLGGEWDCELYLKREDLAHTGAHKINNAVGQVLLARRMGAKRVIAETGAGQHGVATAAACSRLGLPCTVYMGEVDAERQAPNVARMKLFGANVERVTEGDRTLRAAINEAIRDWVSDPEGTYYVIGSVVGPHPYPWLVRELQSVIGRESKSQMEELGHGRPDAVVACVGGGSNAIGIFRAYLDDPEVALLGVEAGGTGPGRNAATVGGGRAGVLHGSRSLLLQDDHGQISDTHSISAGLDYPGVGPEHAMLAGERRVRYVAVSDREALSALQDLCRFEGILPALETAHALAGARQLAGERSASRILVCLSGRGDKDIDTLMSHSRGVR